MKEPPPKGSGSLYSNPGQKQKTSVPHFPLDIQSLIVPINNANQRIPSTLDRLASLTCRRQQRRRRIREVRVIDATKERHSHVDVDKQHPDRASLAIPPAIAADDRRRHGDGEAGEADRDRLVELAALAAGGAYAGAGVLTGGVEHGDEAGAAEAACCAAAAACPEGQGADAGDREDFEGHRAAATATTEDVAAEVVDVGAHTEVDGVAAVGAGIAKGAEAAAGTAVAAMCEHGAAVADAHLGERVQRAFLQRGQGRRGRTDLHALRDVEDHADRHTRRKVVGGCEVVVGLVGDQAHADAGVDVHFKDLDFDAVAADGLDGDRIGAVLGEDVGLDCEAAAAGGEDRVLGQAGGHTCGQVVQQEHGDALRVAAGLVEVDIGAGGVGCGAVDDPGAVAQADVEEAVVAAFLESRQPAGTIVDLHEAVGGVKDQQALGGVGDQVALLRGHARGQETTVGRAEVEDGAGMRGGAADGHTSRVAVEVDATFPPGGIDDGVEHDVDAIASM